MDSDRIAYRTLRVCCGGHALCHLTMLMFPTLLVTMPEDLGVSSTQLGLAGAVGYLLFGAGAVAAGWVTDRWGARLALTVYFLGGATGLAILGTAPGMTEVWLGMIVLGLANSIYHPAGMTAISLTQHARRGRSMGILGIAGSIGVATGPLAAGVLGGAFGWRMAYLIVGGLMVFGGLLTWTYLPRKARIIEMDAHGTKVHAAVASGKGSTKSLAWLYMAMTAQGIIYRLMMTASPLYVLHAMPWPGWFQLAWLGIVTSVVTFFGIPGQLLGGLAADGGRTREAYLGTVGLSLALMMGLFLLPGFAGLPVLVVFMFVHFAAQPVENMLVAQRTASARRSLSYGLKFILTFGAGSVVVPLVTYLSDRDQLHWLFLCGALVAGAGLLCIRAGFATDEVTEGGAPAEAPRAGSLPAD